MKEIFTKIWKFLWERTGRKELDSDEIWLLERMDRIAAIEEPDYDRMWERIRRKTICKNSPRVKLWRGVAAVALPMAVICTAVYFFREKTQQPSGQFLVENQKETSSRISLTLGNGKVLKIPKGFEDRTGCCASGFFERDCVCCFRKRRRKITLSYDRDTGRG